MDFISFDFYLFLAAVVILYYLLPLRVRWIVLLVGSFLYYYLATDDVRNVFFFIGVIILSWLLGLLQEKLLHVRKSVREAVMLASVVCVLLPLLLVKSSSYLGLTAIMNIARMGWIATLGLSFFTMQIIAYQVDVYRETIPAQHNLFHYALFISFFPQIIQGPIPRYDQLQPQLIEGHRFDDDGFVKGFMLILWGFFLKLMIADKAGLIVDVIFDSYKDWQGCYVLVGGVLYSIQLYADFLACVTLAQGAAELFGIHLTDNFRRPYFSTSVKEFWGRWHISLSAWLKDYIYIPLGGSRRGRLRRYFNLMVTFLISGLWHGVGGKYIIWGMVHAGYEIVGDLTCSLREEGCRLAGMPKGCRSHTYVSRAVTFAFVMLGWIIFRADTLTQGVYMLCSLFTVNNVWILLNGELLSLGVEWPQWLLLAVSVMVLIIVSMKQEKGVCIRNEVLQQPLMLRWGIYILAIVVIMIFGTYGAGYNEADFIYGGF